MRLQWVALRRWLWSGLHIVLLPKRPQLTAVIQSIGGVELRLIEWSICHALLCLTAKSWRAQYHVYAAEHLRVQGK